MKKWNRKVKIKNKIFEVIEHTDKECENPRRDGKYLAPRSHGFVCLYRNGIYEEWCGVFFAERHII
jgi:hypothetical protein